MVISTYITGNVNGGSTDTRSFRLPEGTAAWTLTRLQLWLPPCGMLRYQCFRLTLDNALLSVFAERFPDHISEIRGRGFMFESTGVHNVFAGGEALQVRVVNDAVGGSANPRRFNVLAEFSDDPVLVVPVMVR